MPGCNVSAKNAFDDFRRQRNSYFLWKFVPALLFHHSVCFLNFARVTTIDDKNLFKPVATCATLSLQVSSLSERMQWSQVSMLKKKKISTKEAQPL